VSASWKDLVRAPLRPQAAYHVPSFPNAIKLDANESPYALSKEALAKIATTLTRDLHRYPDANASELRALVAQQLGVDGTELIFGNGSDELLTLLCSAFGEPRTQRGGGEAIVMYPTPGFVVYKTAALSHGMAVVEVPLGSRFEADEAALLAAVEREQPNLIFLATPNNPTGTEWSRGFIEKLIAQHPECITVVDEAYLAYTDAKSCIDLALAHPHCVVLQTLSKIGLAGLRVGYLVGRREVVAELEKVRPPYNLDTMSQRAATVILRDHRAEIDAHAQEVKAERAKLFAALGSLPGFEVFPSGANFFLVRAPEATRLYQSLAERGVVVRCFDRPGPLAGCLRVTVGTPDENAWLLDAIRASR
jgi:histidinol-phosphate aminotransferase